ncbi:di-heme oxidoredictase family protein [Pendulispora albinea]|uniref:C-type cytochrome n=1 Tax=Pendulispora albinea TaxID=2741071 RepID=A0ABZ2M4Y0_9BACT
MAELVRAFVGLGVLSAVAAGWACGSSDSSGPQPPGVEAGVELLGGGTTIFDDTPNAYTFAARNLDSEGREVFAEGDHFFGRNWVTAPASTSGNDGLGPTFNAISCSSCHFKDGRGKPPAGKEEFVGLLIRLSVPGKDAQGAPLEEPNYGGQFNHRGILGVPGEGTSRVRYDEAPGTYVDGEAYSLRRPTYELTDLAFGPLAPGTMMSPRVAPPMIGLGLLEAISEETLLGLADEQDRDGDGISGRPNRVWNLRAGKATLGRFGWKANQPTVEQQSAGAFQGDIGITTSLFRTENCPPSQTACRAAPSGGTPNQPELTDAKLTAVTRYGMTVAVPARRSWTDPAVLRGEEAFAAAKCTSCHVPKLQTGNLEGYPALSHQTIRPFTDLLLHDMGPDLADGRPDFEATGTEWRTPPLWGVGLMKTVSKHQFLLHDGRARGFAEAILWHGGEASASREAFRAMSKDEREALIKFLESL